MQLRRDRAVGGDDVWNGVVEPDLEIIQRAANEEHVSLVDEVENRSDDEGDDQTPLGDPT